ncbi:hypothetical protein Avbf_05953 [Armadillidium vulgare]|nr:hypothetical protein Avbf_05953 [Armadillidium vulgare]
MNDSNIHSIFKDGSFEIVAFNEHINKAYFKLRPFYHFLDAPDKGIFFRGWVCVVVPQETNTVIIPSIKSCDKLLHHIDVIFVNVIVFLIIFHFLISGNP